MVVVKLVTSRNHRSFQETLVEATTIDCLTSVVAEGISRIEVAVNCEGCPKGQLFRIKVKCVVITGCVALVKEKDVQL